MKSTASIKFLGGVPITVPNRTDDVDTGSPHWYISYNNRDIRDYGCDTTALVLGNGECFFVLNGDHREGLRNCIQSNDLSRSPLVKCLAYLRAYKDKLSIYSDPLI